MGVLEELAAFAHWGLAHPVYGFGAIVGLVLGIFYGFDGWRGDTTELAYQDSPRVKNALYILTAGFAAFLGDVKALDPAVDKGLLMLAYAVPCAVAGSLVVVFWGMVVGIQRLVAGWMRQNYGYRFGDAIGDYFFYGYRYYRKQSEAARQNQSARFHATYLVQLTYTLTAAGSVTPATPMERRLEVARSILRFVAAVIKSYHRVGDDNTEGIRASLMLASPCNDQLRQQLIFAGPNPAAINRCLRLVAYDVDDNEPGIVLPVPDPAPDALIRALPGAPTAFLHPDGMAAIDDTSQIAYAAAVPQQIQAEINGYFRQRLFKSFGCIRIIGAGVSLGVLNVEGRVTQVFGRSDEEKRRIAQYLLPFCAALGIVFSNQ